MNKLFLKVKNAPLPLKSSVAFTICNAFQKGLSLFSVIIFTRLLTVEEYGTYSLFSSWALILVVFTTLNMSDESLNNAMIKYSDDKDGYTSSVSFLYLILTFIVFGIYSLVFLFARDNITRLIGLDYKYMSLLFLQLLFTPVVSFWINRNKFDYKYKSVTIITIVMTLLVLLVSVLSTLFIPGEDKLFIRIISMIIVQAAFGIAIFVILISKGKKIVNWEYWKYALKFNLPLIPYYLSIILLNQADRIMIQYYQSETETAYYSIGYNVASTILLITNGIVSAFNPWVYKKLANKEEDIEPIRKVMQMLFVFIGLLTIVFMLCIPELVRLIAGTKYDESIKVIPPLALSIFFIFVSQCIVLFIFFYYKKIFVFISSIAVVIINIVLNFILIPRFGYEAAAYTTLVSYFLLSLAYLLFFFVIKKNNRLPRFPLVLFFVESGILIAVTLFVHMIYNYVLYRYIILGVIVAGLIAFGIVYLKRRKKAND